MDLVIVLSNEIFHHHRWIDAKIWVRTKNVELADKQGRRQPNTAGGRGRKKFQLGPNFYHIFAILMIIGQS